MECNALIIQIHHIGIMEDVQTAEWNALICGWMEDVLFVEKSVIINMIHHYGQMEYVCLAE